MELSAENIKPLLFPQEVGKTEANKFGLYDMHGNVAEPWCGDWYRSEAYKDAVKDNPTGPADGDKRVVRGGSFRDPASGQRGSACAPWHPDPRTAPTRSASASSTPR